MKSHRNAGQFNLRGKKTLLLRCRCCSCIDHRQKYNEDIEYKLMMEELEETNVSHK